MNDLFDLVDPAELGTDVRFSGDDLAVTATRDLEVIEGEDYVDDMVRRRLTTPRGALATWVQDADGLKLIQSYYGNGALRYKSEPLTTEVVNAIRDELRLCLADEPLITVEGITLSIMSNQDVVTPVYDIAYTIRSSGEARSLRFARDADDFTLA